MTSVERPTVDHRSLITRVQEVVGAVAPDEDLDDTLRNLAAAIVADIGPELGVTGGRLYGREGRDYLLIATFGAAKPVRRGTRLPGDYPSVEQARARGTVFVDPDDPGLDRKLEEELGAGAFAAIEIGEDLYLMAFDLAPGHHRDDALFSLGLLRQALSQRVRQGRMEDVVRQARRIQTSILPRELPAFGNYSIAARSDALETVGGDFYDFLPITDKILGLAIADVSGHGLPAALQVRDIYMGLRMGMARDLKIVRTVERLNQIIHLSTLTSRFVSMVYGELEVDGTFIYVNAGHPPPFHLCADGTVHQLERGGVVLGPVPEATYQRGYLTMRPGDMLVFYTDGIVDTACDGAQQDDYGQERLLEVARQMRGEPAAAVVEAIFDDVTTFCGGATAGDDRTLTVVTLPL